jgi:competence ComEA-like helix-hairpin-helix protein
MTTHPPATRYDVSFSRRNISAGLGACAIFAAALMADQQSRPLDVGREMPLWGPRISAATERVNPNTASAGSLQRLPGIGKARAKSIIAYRQAHGPVAFACPEDLANIRGIGPATVRNVAQNLAFDRPAAPPGAESAPAAPLNPQQGGS